MNPLCIYHFNCADGFASAWAVRQALVATNFAHEQKATRVT